MNTNTNTYTNNTIINTNNMNTNNNNNTNTNIDNKDVRLFKRASWHIGIAYKIHIIKIR
jgi:hypothetical protein